MKKLKVLMLGWEFPPFNSGGLGVACQHLSEALADRGINISFLLPWKVNAHSNKLEMIFADDTQVVDSYRPFMSGYITSEEYARLTAEEKAMIDNDLVAKVINYARKAGSIVGKNHFDIYHAHDWLTFKAGLKAREQSPGPLIGHVHSTEYDRCGGKGTGNNYCLSLEQQMVQVADQVIAVSNYTKEILCREYSADPSKISVVHNGTIFPSKQPAAINVGNLISLKKAGYKLVAFTGRFTMHKGVDNFLRAAKKVLQYQPRIYFILAGSGEMESQLVNLTASLGISQNVLFTGFLRGSQLQRLYQEIDLLVLPSVSEPFGMTPLEALVYKTPVIISKQSGVKEVLPNSLMVDFWDVDELTNEIASVLRYRSLKTTLGNNGHADAKRNTWEKAAEKVSRIYQNLLGLQPTVPSALEISN